MATRVVVKDKRGNVVGERPMVQAERDVEAIRLTMAAERLDIALPGVARLLRQEANRLRLIRVAPAPVESP